MTTNSVIPKAARSLRSLPHHSARLGRNPARVDARPEIRDQQMHDAVLCEFLDVVVLKQKGAVAHAK